MTDLLLAGRDILRMLLHRGWQENARLSSGYGECVERSDTFLDLEER